MLNEEYSKSEGTEDIMMPTESIQQQSKSWFVIESRCLTTTLQNDVVVKICLKMKKL